MPPASILVAPDSFKGSLSASEAAESIRRGVIRAYGTARVEVCPLSDGGEGLASVLASALGGTTRSCLVTGPLGQRIEARWIMLGDGHTAVIESAAAIGLSSIPKERRAPTRTTTFGVGELVREAIAAGARKIIVGLGGSATTDGGAGMAQALGVKFEGVTEPVFGGRLTDIQCIDVRGRDARMAGVELMALCDVDNPLTGSEGAAFVYGPQKGASKQQVGELDAALSHLAGVAGDPGVFPGDGAAGGLGYGLRVFAGARLTSGIDFVLDAVGFDAKLEGCDLVLTGEGRLDAQSARGKVVGGVSRRCRARGVPVVALVGAIGTGASLLREQGLTAFFSICDRATTESEAMEHASILLESLAYEFARTRLASGTNDATSD